MTSYHVDVAVPLPIDELLTYSVPEALVAHVEPGIRVRVRVGKRRLVGTVLAIDTSPPAEVATRDIEAVVDRQPVLPPELLELARFGARYYMAPPGEVVRAMLPARLPPWGDLRVRLTDRGALASLRDADERRLVEYLLEHGPGSLAEMQSELSLERAARVVRRLEERALVTLSRPGAKGSRYVTAVELAKGDLEHLLERCGRSKPGRRVVRYLADIGRPATLPELLEAAECGRGVVQRLIRLDLLRRFTQLDRLPLDRHLMDRRREAPIVLRPDQTTAVGRLVEATDTGDYAAFLLRGMTGSGKTEVYLRVVEHALERGRGSILLVPEISLVPALARTVRDRFGDRLAILHSALGRAERHQEWERLASGEARVVLGPRSAVFAPVRDLAFVVVDEEQDSSYKQESTPRYHGRDLALVRARSAGATALLVSATPSLESRRNVERGRLEALDLTERVGQGSLPEGILVDLRAEPAPRRPGEVVFSQRLSSEIERTLGRGEQVILLRNRRGYAPVLLCRACGHDHACDDCGLPRTLHRRPQRLLCHYCGSSLAVPTRCASCDGSALEPVGTGTERVEETFRDLFPDIATDVLDRDAARRLGSTREILDRFARGETRVLIGTQMVSKGHHFPGVTLTAVLHADSYLSFPDFRAVERTYALLTQLAGRAGRGDEAGRVVIQTFHPEHYAIRAALEHRDADFAEQEMRFRRIFHYPPFTRMTQVLLRGARRETVDKEASELAERLAAGLRGSGVRLSGPAPAPFERLKGKWRYQLLLRGPEAATIRRALGDALDPKARSEIVVDVDPYQLL